MLTVSAFFCIVMICLYFYNFFISLKKKHKKSMGQMQDILTVLETKNKILIDKLSINLNFVMSYELAFAEIRTEILEMQYILFQSIK